MDKQKKKARIGKGLFWLGCASWILTALLSLLALAQGGTAGGMGFFMVLFFGGIISAIWSTLCWIPANILAGRRYAWLKKATVILAVLSVAALAWGVYVSQLDFAAR